MDVTAHAEQAGRRADDSKWMDYAVRVGLVSYGVVHLIIAWLAVRLAFGGGGNASQKGALHQLAQSGLGRLSLYVVAAGFLALVVWQGLEALAGHHDEDGGKRVLKRLTSAGKVVVYGSLGVTAFATATGSSSSGGGGTKGTTAKLMGLPFGPFLVGVVGVVVLVVAGFLVYRGWSEEFRSKLDVEGRFGKDGRAYILLGKIGYISKGVAIAIVGVLFLYAAFTHDPHKSGGLDQALHKVLQEPFGAPVLVVIAAGFACYGLFCFAWAKHLDR